MTLIVKVFDHISTRSILHLPIWPEKLL